MKSNPDSGEMGHSETAAADQNEAVEVNEQSAPPRRKRKYPVRKTARPPTSAKAERQENGKTGSRRKSGARASRPDAPAAGDSDGRLEPAEQTEAPVPAAPEPQAAAEEGEGGQEKGKQKTRRGRRGGKNRHRKPGAPQGFIDPLTIVAMLEMTLALPPAPEPARSRQRKSAEKQQRPQAVRQMFISVLQGEQVEVALAENGQLLEYYLDMLHQSKLKGNIYKGIVHNIDSSLQAAFVDYGAGKNGFLQIDQIHPEYWRSVPEQGQDRKFPPIQKVLKLGQEVLVQVVKEPAGSKGAFLTTWLSLAGRFLVLTPGQEQIGVSRKVVEPEERARLKELMSGIDPGKGFGVIVRTVGEGATKTTLKNDLQYLKRLWREIRKKATELPAPTLIHEEPGLPERSVRDYLTDDISEIWVDDPVEAEHVRAMVGLLFPRKRELVRLYADPSQTMWEKFNLADQLDQIYAREVSLPSGGRLVFDQTEALMAIDINSGKISGKNNFEAMAFKTNLEAAQAIARQLRLRDIGGQVVIDFIEMRDRNHIQEVEKSLRQAMKSDRARHDVLRMSAFGLLELVRQRMSSSALSISMEVCQACGGTGMRRNMEWQAMQALRDLRRNAPHAGGPRYICEYPRELGMYLLNFKREALQKLESDLGKSLEIRIHM